MIIAATAYAADWQKYSNDRFGVSIEVPEVFKQLGDAPDNNDGLTFASADGKSTWRVWGNNIVADSFKDELQANFESDETDGWAVSYGAGNKQKTMTWAVYSGTKGDMIMYEKSIASCEGTQSLHFRIEYPIAQKLAYDAVVTHISKSLKAGAATDCH